MLIDAGMAACKVITSKVDVELEWAASGGNCWLHRSLAQAIIRRGSGKVGTYAMLAHRPWLETSSLSTRNNQRQTKLQPHQ